MEPSHFMKPSQIETDQNEDNFPQEIQEGEWGGSETSENKLIGIHVLETNNKRISVAAHAGSKYNKNNEAALLKLNVNKAEDESIAQITEFREASFARGSGAGQEVLIKSERIARDRGMDKLEFQKAQPEFAHLSSIEKENIISILREDGYNISCTIEMTDGSKGVISLSDSNWENNIRSGKLLSVDAVKDLSDGNTQRLERRPELSDFGSNQFDKDINVAFEGYPPERLHLSPEVSEDLDKMWEASIKDAPEEEDPVREYGCLLIKNSKGKIVTSHIIKGKKGSVKLPNPNPGEDVIGYGHTHPYESGLTDMCFSGEDLAFLLGHEDYQCGLVRSGDTVFALIKRENTPSITSDKQWEKVANEINSNFIYYKSGKITETNLQKASEKAIKDACIKYNLVFYKGEAGKPLKNII